MTRIALLADLHFGAHDPALVSALEEDIALMAPDVVAVAGDLTYRARPEEFTAAARFLGGLGLPVVAVPGNHDIPSLSLFDRFLDPFRDWRLAMGPEMEPAWSNAEVGLLGLNTVRRAALRKDWSAGRVSPPQLQRLAVRAAALPGRLLFVVAHHPFLHPPGNETRGKLGRAPLALAAFARLGITAVLTGHLHRPTVIANPGAPLLVITGTAVSWRRPPGAQNAWSLIETAERGVIVSHRAHGPAGFAPLV
ncbi:3',5'-cyclic AMP phosphodiesterase CpdA [Humitalea rosea]|uniref:3',5'-cyclic AMP phosphodiesterase CpdA n=1 Tax=Humitalea rosea TaxID=990373 RepID=A0A2W7IFX6_9PROT|nr:metallophosphoesterase [Humitalea rosea]PZW45856.1 3',5'-cyclic AMP phosphodiesterase CpdA [Humitalea rosea]